MPLTYTQVPEAGQLHDTKEDVRLGEFWKKHSMSQKMGWGEQARTSFKS